MEPTNAQSGGEPGRITPLATLPFVVGACFCLTRWASPPLALMTGAVLAVCLGNPMGRSAHRLSKWLLQASVVLLGFGMNLLVVLKIGASGALLAAGLIGMTFILGALLGRWLRLNGRTSALISAGTAICGGSAIAAVGSAVGADEADITVAMGTVFLLNAVALYLFPMVGRALRLTDHQFGMWAGVAIHDVSSVVGAASRFGLNAVQIATAVKLSRALWIVPITLGISLTMKQRLALTNATFGFDAAEQATPHKVQIPWFIGLFLLASVCRSFLPGVSAAAPALSHLATIGLTLTLFLIGSNLSINTLQAVGWRALAQGVVLWVFVSVLSLLAILRV